MKEETKKKYIQKKGSSITAICEYESEKEME